MCYRVMKYGRRRTLPEDTLIHTHTCRETETETERYKEIEQRGDRFCEGFRCKSYPLSSAHGCAEEAEGKEQRRGGGGGGEKSSQEFMWGGELRCVERSPSLERRRERKREVENPSRSRVSLKISPPSAGLIDCKALRKLPLSLPSTPPIIIIITLFPLMSALHLHLLLRAKQQRPAW